MNDPKEESSNMQDSSPDPTDPLPPPLGPTRELKAPRIRSPKGGSPWMTPPRK